MTLFLIKSQIFVFLHVACGELAGASLLWTFKELLHLSADRLKWLKASLWIAFAGVMMAWVFGGGYYLLLYPLVKPVINAGPEAWAHGVFTETKEHLFLFLPILIFLLAVYAQKRGNVLVENKALRKKYLIFVGLTALLVFSMAIMGYMITWGARTALWLQAGL